MNDFLPWRNWAPGLDEHAFARLWRALGAVAALRPMTVVPVDLFKKVLSRAMVAQELRWRFPVFDDTTSIAIRAIASQDWFDQWKRVIDARLDKAPLRIESWPKHDPAGEWFRVLASVAPVATLQLDSPGNPMLGWPLRFAALQAKEQDTIRQATSAWPANRLARIVGEHASCINCDVLLLGGEWDNLRSQLDGGTVSANLVVLCLQRPWLPDDAGKLEQLIESTRAGGCIVIESADAIDLPGRLNRFVEELSHARRTDVAASLSFAGLTLPSQIAFSDALARFTIRDFAGRLLSRSKLIERQDALPSTVRELLDEVVSHVPPPRSVPPRSSGLESAGAEPGSAQRGLDSLGGEQDVPDAPADPGVSFEAVPAADEVQLPDYERFEPHYGQESGGASSLVKAAAALDRAEATISAQRYLQQKAYVETGGERKPARNGFVVGALAVLEVFIGPPDRAANAMPDAFPEAALPQELESWDLRVWVAEPDYLPKPLRGDIVLRRIGKSTSCEFAFKPEHEGQFNGRISVLHRGRVIQTAALRASVTSGNPSPEQAIAPTLDRVLQVRQNLSNLDRRPFDLALVLNHAGVGQPTVHAMGSQRAWLANLRVVEKTVADLNKLLSGLTRTAKDYIGGLDSEKGKTLVRKLAQVGSYLHLYLVESQKNAMGAAPGADVLDGEFIQVVSTRSDAIVIPFEFIYAFEAPDDDATPCANWRDAVASGHCAATCQHGAKSFCPMGFWGLSKVIERHALQAGLANEGEVGVQSVAVSGRDTLKIAGNVVFGYSNNVKKESLAPLLQRIGAARLNAREAKDWKEWSTLVGAHGPSLLIALAHSDGAGFSATVEIGGEAIKTIGITAGHIRGNAQVGERPLVALLGCDMAGTGDDYSNPVAVFAMRGAAAVIGTIATVLADDAAVVAARVMQGLTFADPSQTRRIGEALRDLKRNALLDGELMPLCLVGFGDADWLLSS